MEGGADVEGGAGVPWTACVCCVCDAVASGNEGAVVRCVLSCAESLMGTVKRATFLGVKGGGAPLSWERETFRQDR